MVAGLLVRTRIIVVFEIAQAWDHGVELVGKGQHGAAAVTAARVFRLQPKPHAVACLLRVDSLAKERQELAEQLVGRADALGLVVALGERARGRRADARHACEVGLHGRVDESGDGIFVDAAARRIKALDAVGALRGHVAVCTEAGKNVC